MQTPENYSENLSLDDKILFVLRHLEGATTQDVTSELIELDGLASEEAVAQLHQEVEARMQILEESGRLERINVHGRRYRLKA